MSLDLSRSLSAIAREGASSAEATSPEDEASQAGEITPKDTAPRADTSSLSQVLRVLARLPRLRVLHLKDNPQLGEQKARERIVLGCQASVELSFPDADNLLCSRAFLKRIALDLADLI